MSATPRVRRTVVVVNESFVKRYSPNESAIGKRVLVEKILPTRRGLGPQIAWEIVGIVADEKGQRARESHRHRHLRQLRAESRGRPGTRRQGRRRRRRTD